jgi:hypothetical protein
MDLRISVRQARTTVACHRAGSVDAPAARVVLLASRA